MRRCSIAADAVGTSSGWVVHTSWRSISRT
jgi:hypothetical protein